MSDLWTATSDADQETSEPTRDGRPRRRISRPRTLPGSRAVVGALLIAAAAVGVFAAYLNATAEPDTRWLVASQDISAGTPLTQDLMGEIAIDIPPQAQSGAIDAADFAAVEGRVTRTVVARGQLLNESNLIDADAADATARMSFPIERARAVGGGLRPDDVVDVVATFGTGGSTETRYVARNVVIAELPEVDSGSLGGSGYVITLALESDDDVLAVAEAIDTGEVFIVRAPLGPDGQRVDDAGAAPPPTDEPASADDPTPDAPDDEPDDDEADGEDADDADDADDEG